MAVAIQAKPWSIEDLERLPDDGNVYEVVRGELFVTPAPSTRHQRIATWNPTGASEPLTFRVPAAFMPF